MWCHFMAHRAFGLCSMLKKIDKVAVGIVKRGSEFEVFLPDNRTVEGYRSVFLPDNHTVKGYRIVFLMFRTGFLT